ncbi:bifunctional ornithine acetyltransferase/N-acetylglutamate synthase [Methanococcoides alaskense]|uniref:Glutamate N-acetyltransferase n=1 Tax=Methanococcoides alaskense TaxID=325778 RepID=A0AA90TY10_9EURY|nr:bifunctional ornithine acetyltransferase/N-acetylglutamate synthase [Methanococcoides alaskense]MDA0525085.1 bifunctional ornithine acetyltransferase/N-acetylglutamate synthase [Methanococcoides alaskense]MDR6221995.1 glutamate N-acetyltransferase/amino-acid N-acetyltransferase [Methanococcoides alaskense]
MKAKDSGLCAVKGVRAFGIKPGKMGLAIIVAEGNAAGVFTRNKVIAAPLIVTREALGKNGRLAAVIANSGNANAFTGEQGLADAREMASILSERLGVDSDLIAVASTGVIGRKLDIDWIRDNVDEVMNGLVASPQGNSHAARAIMTTDTFPKMTAIELDCGVCIGGIAKGSGMIEPNMGTMLGFVYTDAALPSDVLDECLKEAVDRSFNMVVVDGDTSTNDMVLLTATGATGISPDINEFKEGLEHVLVDLAKQIAKDGEGATRLIEAQVTGAVSEEDARLVAKAIVRSPLVKSAIFGKDPNWGRVVAAAGYSGAELEQDRLSLAFSNGVDTVYLVNEGKILSEDKEHLQKLEAIMGSSEVIIMVGLSLGNANAKAWGCDLTYDYVRINAEYTT